MGPSSMSESGPSTASPHTSGNWGILPTISKHHGVHCNMPKTELLPFDTYVHVLSQAMRTLKIMVASLKIMGAFYLANGGQAFHPQAPGRAGNLSGPQPHSPYTLSWALMPFLYGLGSLVPSHHPPAGVPGPQALPHPILLLVSHHPAGSGGQEGTFMFPFQGSPNCIYYIVGEVRCFWCQAPGHHC